MTSRIHEDVSSSTIGVSSPARTGSDKDRWFSLLWPLAVLFHLAGNGSHLLPLDRIGAAQLVMAAVAIIAIVRPKPRSVFSLAGVYLVVLAWKLPFVGNHEVLLGLVALIIVISVPLSNRRDVWWLTLAGPAIRLVLVIGYGFIAFSKLNSGFFDLVASCALIFADDLLGPIGPGSGSFGVPERSVVWFTAGIELAIPILLVIRRTRPLGVLVALGFHFLLALDPSSHVWDFSSALLPMFVLFGSGELRCRLDAMTDRISAFVEREVILWFCVVAALHGLVLIINSRLDNESALRPWFGPWLIAYPLWLGTGGVVLVIASRTFVATSRAAVQTTGRSYDCGWMPAAPLMVVVALAAVNGLGPYFEYRSAAAFNMYSNLQIIDGRSNHFLIWGRSGDGDEPSTIGIVSADLSSSLDYYVKNDLALPVETLDRYLLSNPDENPLVATGDGETSTARTLGYGQDPPSGFVENAASYLRYKLAFRRAVDHTGADRCLRVWGPLG